jgi:hypothetical protein
MTRFLFAEPSAHYLLKLELEEPGLIAFHWRTEILIGSLVLLIHGFWCK